MSLSKIVDLLQRKFEYYSSCLHAFLVLIRFCKTIRIRGCCSTENSIVIILTEVNFFLKLSILVISASYSNLFLWHAQNSGDILLTCIRQYLWRRRRRAFILQRISTITPQGFCQSFRAQSQNPGTLTSSLVKICCPSLLATRFFWRES